MNWHGSTSAQQVFDNQGFVIHSEVFSEKELLPLRSLTERIAGKDYSEWQDPFEKYYMQHRTDQGTLYDLYQRHPEYRHLIDNAKVLDLLEEVMGPDILLYENSLVYKPRGKRNEVPWHQDFMNRTDEPEKLIVWIALDDVTIENGALKILPGTHKLGFQDWYRVKGETHHTRLKLDNVDTSNYEYAEMKAGDVLIFHHLVIHGSDRVSSNKPRRALRFSVQSLEDVFSPRATPIVLRGCLPERVYENFKDVPRKKETFIQNLLHKVGKRLLRV